MRSPALESLSLPWLTSKLQCLLSQTDSEASPFMPRSTLLKPSHKAIKRYYEALRTYREQRVDHEGATETGFQQRLAETGRAHDLTLIPKLKVRGTKGKNIFPDGTLHDAFSQVPGQGWSGLAGYSDGD
jgi:hypothetical protein